MHSNAAPTPAPANFKTGPSRTSLRSGDTMGIGEGARPRQAQNAAQPHQGLPSVSFFSFFFLPTGLRSLEALSGGRPTELTMQQPGKEKGCNEYPGGLPYEFYAPLRSLPLEGDMFNSPVPCLSHYLYRPALTAVFI